MAVQPHQRTGSSAGAPRSHHAAAPGAAKQGVHPQRKHVANHLRGVADQVENSAVAHEPMTPTEKNSMRAGLKYAREHVGPASSS